MAATLEGAGLGLASCALTAAVAETEPFALEARAFFVSWQGVLTLAYRGFPPPLTALKARLAESVPSLPAENPGSRWPKTTLGCLREGKRLGKEELGVLQAACARHSELFGGSRGLGREAGRDAPSASALSHPYALVPREVHLIVFAQRSLEKTVASVPIAIRGRADAARGVFAPPSPAERARLEAVLAEGDEANYWFHASKDGNRETHYRGTAFGATVAVPVTAAAVPGGAHRREGLGEGEAQGGAEGQEAGGRSAPLLSVIEAFRRDVDAALPGYYVWFEDSSLHVTIRGICG